MAYSHPAVILSIRIAPEMKKKLDQLSDATGRTKSFLAAEAIENYLETQSWQVKEIKKALKKANDKKTKFIEHHKVVDWVNSWGTQKEKGMPE
jgi:RHH-type rel operon transcriptional repressor/antitoxin RelB